MKVEISELYRVPLSQPFESPSSWASRAALAQGVLIRPFLEHLGIDPRGDVDLNLILADQDRIRRTCQLPVEHLWLSRRILSRLVDIEVDTKSFLLSSTQMGRPMYRFCPKCLKDQTTPHLPIHWRFAGFRYCRVHHCMLEDECQQCGSKVSLPVSQITSGSESKGVAYLKLCMTCGADLSKAETISTQQTFSLTNNLEQTKLRNGIAVLAALYLGYLETDDCDSQRPLAALRRIDAQNMLPHQPDWLSVKLVRRRLEQRIARHAMERMADIATT